MPIASARRENREKLRAPLRPKKNVDEGFHRALLPPLELSRTTLAEIPLDSHSVIDLTTPASELNIVSALATTSSMPVGKHAAGFSHKERA